VIYISIHVTVSGGAPPGLAFLNLFLDKEKIEERQLHQ
jgi:hypothetical protein